jgi:hypothetical protein
VPVLLPVRRVDGVHVVVRRGDVHHTVHHHRRDLHRLLDLGLKNERRAQLRDVARVDLSAGEKARVGVAAVGLEIIGGIDLGRAQHFLRDPDVGWDRG